MMLPASVSISNTQPTLKPTPLCRLLMVERKLFSLFFTDTNPLPTQYSAVTDPLGDATATVHCSGCMVFWSPQPTACAGSRFARPRLPSILSSFLSHLPRSIGDLRPWAGSANCICETCGSPLDILNGPARWFSRKPVDPNKSP